MISVDTNILFHAFNPESGVHGAAVRFLEGLALDEKVVISEFVLSEFYLLLRNPAVIERPLDAGEAVEVIRAYRDHPLWRVAGFPPGSRNIHDRIWQRAAAPGFARRRIYDVRIAECLLASGARDFATTNVKDFEGLGFRRVWNPLEEGVA